MVFEYKILPVQNDLLSSTTKKGGGESSRKKSFKKSKDRRKALEDRRKGVRDGVIVSLSVNNDRRSGKDRRQNESSES